MDNAFQGKPNPTVTLPPALSSFFFLSFSSAFSMVFLFSCWLYSSHKTLFTVFTTQNIILAGICSCQCLFPVCVRFQGYNDLFLHPLFFMHKLPPNTPPDMPPTQALGTQPGPGDTARPWGHSQALGPGDTVRPWALGTQPGPGPWGHSQALGTVR